MTRDDIDTEVITCWCGARGTYEELFDDDYLDETCHGSGTLYCHCGGDLCVCHNHFEAQCPGCDDCKPDGDEDDGDEYPEEQP